MFEADQIIIKNNKEWFEINEITIVDKGYEKIEESNLNNKKRCVYRKKQIYTNEFYTNLYQRSYGNAFDQMNRQYYNSFYEKKYANSRSSY